MSNVYELAICDQNNKVIIKYVTIFEWFRVVFMSCRTGRKCIHTPFPLIYPQHIDSKQLPGTVKILLINNFMNIVIHKFTFSNTDEFARSIKELQMTLCSSLL